METSLFDRYNKLIWFFIEQANPPRSIDREDLVQSVWVKLLQGDAKGKPLAQTYVKRTVESAVVQAINDRDDHRAINSTDSEHPVIDSIAQESDDHDTPEFLDVVMKELPERDAEILRLRYVQGLSHRALATRYKCSLDRVNYLIKRAKKRARGLA